MEKRIEGWQAKLLSQGGRLVLVNSVLSNLALYFFSVFKAPKWVLRRLEVLRRAFFWRGNTTVTGGQCLVQWKTVCRSKMAGGLGVKDLEAMNIALLAKWWWRFFSERNHQWGSLITDIYYQRRKPLMEGQYFRPHSFWWRSVLTTKNIFKCGLSFLIGDGRTTNFWTDIWVDQLPLRTSFPNIFDNVISKNLRVQECWSRQGWKWRKILAGFSPITSIDIFGVQEFKDAISATALRNQRDVARWRWARSETFSVKSLYQFLQDSGVINKRFVRLWKIQSPLKVKILLWLVLKNKVLTMDNLQNRGWSGDDKCVFCLEEAETVDHLFAGCVCTSAILEGLLPNKHFLRQCSSSTEIWETSCSMGGARGGRELTTIAATWWVVWLERNRRIFVHSKLSLGFLSSEIRNLKCQWVNCCSSFKWG